MTAKTLAILIACLTSLSASAAAQAQTREQEEELQRCIWRCLADSPGADSAEYHSCVRRLCEGQRPTNEAPASGGWTNRGAERGGVQMASVTVGASTLAFSCQPGKPAVLGIDGLPGPPQGIVVTVDGRRFEPSFVAQNSTHYTVLAPGSALLAALMAGNQVQLRNPRGNSVSTFPLRGSARAIGTAMQRCGMAR